ncbi:UDP-N-acetylmuramate dehydrogenase [Blautia sp. MSK20_18]|uniref:UDP-N-acetylmuramate dehydrogenase n=1 Tax=Blautia sp. MSK20_18 TaxID=2883186 RepID=UPI00223825D4|nr:UDP-N-acetylmuramate dehydrogenase [Blautia sp. MSK20_18]MCB7508000.1 UDP-N-acetylmuramate dehydrogenase [Blautia sp. MSK20_18]
MNSEIIKKFCDLLGEERVFTGEAMSCHTTFKIGGPADYFLMPDKDTDVGRIVKICKESAIPYFILGNGSNLLVGDGGYRGAVIQIYKNMSAVTVEGTEITVQAGALLSSVAAAAKNAALTGFEFAGGIPGTMGGAVVMNAGAYGGEMKDVLTEVTVMDEEGEIVTLPADKLELGYRTSIIKTAGYIVLEAKLQLKEGNPEVIRETMKDLTIRRTTKQPLEYPSAGSTFKRPEGYFAGKLIMDSGLAGYQVGGAQVSEKHCGFVINAGGATARDVRTLMDNVRDIVYKKYGVTLEPEVKFLGDFEA